MLRTLPDTLLTRRDLVFFCFLNFTLQNTMANFANLALLKQLISVFYQQ